MQIPTQGGGTVTVPYSMNANGEIAFSGMQLGHQGFSGAQRKGEPKDGKKKAACYVCGNEDHMSPKCPDRLLPKIQWKNQDQYVDYGKKLNLNQIGATVPDTVPAIVPGASASTSGASSVAGSIPTQGGGTVTVPYSMNANGEIAFSGMQLGHQGFSGAQRKGEPKDGKKKAACYVCGNEDHMSPKCPDRLLPKIQWKNQDQYVDYGKKLNLNQIGATVPDTVPAIVPGASASTSGASSVAGSVNTPLRLAGTTGNQMMQVPSCRFQLKVAAL
ncbi:unnamed protein product [Cylindrotheca closterium]|uniref:CCHC-type domain-containing protein n=1 Tax=Cylindrotheca closterium TaxID=2856 RepID=A0AAD2FV18_9STRA|nr:unnamed protein product [Cylindrotheca closterium]